MLYVVHGVRMQRAYIKLKTKGRTPGKLYFLLRILRAIVDVLTPYGVPMSRKLCISEDRTGHTKKSIILQTVTCEVAEQDMIECFFLSNFNSIPCFSLRNA